MNVTIMAIVFMAERFPRVWCCPPLCVWLISWSYGTITGMHSGRISGNCCPGWWWEFWWVCFAGKDIDESLFRKIMAIIIVLTVFTMLWLEIRKRPLFRRICFCGGARTGIRLYHHAGQPWPVLFPHLFPGRTHGKNDFIGTAAWLFF